MRLVILSLGLLACAGASSEWVGPNTADITCKRSVGNCYREAERLCPQGYDVIGGADRSGAYVHGPFVSPVYSGELVIRCREQQQDAIVIDRKTGRRVR